jgi:hypothetical protein
VADGDGNRVPVDAPAAGQRRRSTAVRSTLIRTAVARRSTMARGMLDGAEWDWTGLDARAA